MYKLTGTISKKRGLTGKEDMGKLIERFTVNQAKFTPAVRKKVRAQQEKIRKHMHAILVDVGMPSEEQNRERSLDCLARTYINTEFAAKYDRLSPELFELKRIVSMRNPKYTNGANPIQVEMPLFMRADLVDSGPVKLEKDITGENKYDTINIRLKIPIPPITKEAKDKAKQAKIDFLEAYSTALKEPVIGDLFLKNEGEYEGGGSFDQYIYWIPRSQDIDSTITVIERDPMIVAKVNGQHFLVAKWLVEGEEPFEHYLAEYKV